MSAAFDPTDALFARSGRVAALLRERDVDLLLVSVPLNVRYLTGYTGSNGMALIAADEQSGRHRFFTDFRYAAQSQVQVPDLFEREIVTGELLDAAVGAAASAGGPGGRLGFDEAALTVKQHTRVLERLADGWELAPCGGIVERLREVKDAGELQRIRAAAELAVEALHGLLEAGVVGRTERDVTIELELRMRRLGAEAPSFPSIVAGGEHGALPHAEPRDVQIPSGALLTIDWGAQLDGYCSDCTRTFATGELPDDAREVYELVRRAQETALAAVRPGPKGSEVDQVARAIIAEAGHAEHFGHGLGHGVGLEIHEGPRLSRTGGDEPLRAGNVVTVEPGVYLPGRFGVRIEDLVFVTADGGEPVGRFTKELITVS
ncbi:MAG TPA: Xaa-Pro peptidase family protein [Solirubrobacteraceae bacterium]|nr:Xaa-Pro peptidase family protein [Solirubrobacteraceae bacterium]